MPKITRYGHERRGNLKAAPDFLSPNLIGRLLGYTHGAIAPAPAEEVEKIRAELEREELPITDEFLTEAALEKMRERLINIGQPISFKPTHVSFAIPSDEVEEDGWFLDVMQPDVPASLREDLQLSLQPFQREFVAHLKQTCRACGRTIEGMVPTENGPCLRIKFDLCPNCYKYTVEQTPIELTGEVIIFVDGPDGTLELHYEATEDGESYLRTVACDPIEQLIIPHDDDAPEIKPVVNNKPTGGEPNNVTVESPRQSGKTASRDWFVRRHEMFDAAVRFLKARAILVDPVDRQAQIRRYRVSGKRNPMFLEDVIEMAEQLGFEAQN